jgi:lipopolysaccharide heptosyltransferase II
MNRISPQRIPYKKNRKKAALIDKILGKFHSFFSLNSDEPEYGFESLRNKNIKTVLIQRLDGMGDLILSTPLFPALRKVFPNAQITLAVPNWSKKLAKLVPDIDEVVFLDPPWVTKNTPQNWYNFFKQLADLRKKNFDLGIELRGDFRLILLQALLKIKWKAGYDLTGCNFALSHIIPAKKSHHETKLIEYLLKTLAPATTFDLNPRLNLTEKIIEKGKNLLLEQKVYDKHSSTLKIILHPGARWPGRQWSAQKNALLADKLIENGHRAIFTGTDTEAKFAQEIMDLMSHKPIFLVGKTDFSTFLGVLASCDLFIGVDSGPMHLASAIGKPVIALFGAASPAVVGPVNNTGSTIYKGNQFKCSPCSQSVCENPGNSCMDAISFEEVWRTTSKVIESIKNKEKSND